jgi:hypothetical protein
MYNATFLVTFLNIVIVALIAVIVYLTSNPLALLGLMMLQQIPVFAPSEEHEEESGFLHDSGDHKIGFTADID